jgi:uncharacterized surface protein with fasciclin (FAS1) repeats
MKNNNFFVNLKKSLQLLTLSVGLTSINAQNTVFDIIANSPNHNTLEAAIKAAGLEATLKGSGTFTVFAPTDAAFEKLPAGTVPTLLQTPQGALKDILLYHVLSTKVESGSITNGALLKPLNTANTIKATKTSTNQYFLNQAAVNAANLQASNGVVHSIDGVLLPNKTVVDVALGSPVHTTLVTAVIAAELLPALTDPLAKYTVFAPTNAAFSLLPAATLNSLLATPTGDLKNILLYHVLGAEVKSNTLTNGQIARPLNTTNTIKVTKTSANAYFVNHASVTTPDLASENGTVHVIDKVILPSKTVVDVAIGSPAHTTLVTAVVAAELLPALTDPSAKYTVFAPTNAAFSLLPAATLNSLLATPTGDLKNILLYHVLGAEVKSNTLTNGQIARPLNTTNTIKVTKTSANAYFVNHASVTTPDLASENGTVHVIDKVILPSKTVVDVALGSPVHTTLVTAVIAAELLPALTDPSGTYTVFAPTNAAFDALPAGTVTTLLQTPTGDLKNILLYHVLGVKVLSTQLSNNQVANTLFTGNSIKITLNNGVFINGTSQVTTPDLNSDNGVVHVVNQVLLPTVTSSSDIVFAKTSVYPNPTSAEINVSSQDIGFGTYKVLSNTGQELMNGVLEGFNNTINTNTLVNGTYMLVLSSQNKTKSYFFVKN